MPPLEWWRDVLITIWAAISIIQTCLLVLLIGAILVLVLRLRGQVSRILDIVTNAVDTARETAGTAQETATAVKGTTMFITDYAAKPAIALASFIAGFRQAVQALIRMSRKEERTK